MKPLAQFLERALWESRLVVIVAVVASVLVAFGLLYIVTVDVVDLFAHIGAYAAAGLAVDARNAMRLEVIGRIVDIIDGYLLAAIMLVFGLGLYELFISRIDALEGSELAERLLYIRSVDDLKDRLGRVVLLMLVVKFFQQALQLKYGSSLDLLYLAVGIALIGVAFFLTAHKGKE